MKKLIIIFGVLLVFLTGCSNGMGTPTEKVEEFLGKYQKMDSEVLSQLDDIISDEKTMSDEQKKDYRSLMEKQYQNMSYKIKNEDIKGDRAVVDVSIEVYDYIASINKSLEYYDEHPEEFSETKETMDDADKSDDADDRDSSDSSLVQPKSEASDSSKFIDYKIKKMKAVTDRMKYDITFNLEKQDGDWVLDNISESDRQKIHGLFDE